MKLVIVMKIDGGFRENVPPRAVSTLLYMHKRYTMNFALLLPLTAHNTLLDVKGCCLEESSSSALKKLDVVSAALESGGTSLSH